MTSRIHLMPFGARLQDDGVHFRLWSPGCSAPSLAIDERDPIRMHRRENDWFELHVPGARAGTRYHFLVNDGLRVPDPASRYQPADVHGPSEVIDPSAHVWTDDRWRGRPWHEIVLYELHVGTFTREGTYRSAIGRLDELADLGITAVELMPLSEAPGRWNWGYDGVLPYAPESSYGSPDDLKAFVEAAHAHGLAVFIDVVYNHFGPEGNYLHAYAPPFFTDRYHTPWGAAIDVEGKRSSVVRDFFIHNALYWFDEYHVDGLRFDAVHAIFDRSNPSFLRELAQRVRVAFPRRRIHLVLENDENDASLLERRTPHYDAQWNDDVHHLLHVLLTGESGGYYRDYTDRTMELLGRALTEGFAYQGEPSAHRDGRPRGTPSQQLPPTAFVNFLQNHDQIGNRALGERIGALAADAAVRAATLVVLLGPAIPLLFMGEEWNASTPFLFFADFGGELASAVREGRRAEFASFPAFADSASRERIPDPGASATVDASRLRGDEREKPSHAEHRAFVRACLDARARAIVPHLGGPHPRTASYRLFGERTIVVQWDLARHASLHIVANLGGIDERLPEPLRDGAQTLMMTGTIAGNRVGAWSAAAYLGGALSS